MLAYIDISAMRLVRKKHLSTVYSIVVKDRALRENPSAVDGAALDLFLWLLERPH